MKMDSYQKLAARTLPADQPWQDRAVNAALGLTGEAGEVADLVKKWKFQEHDLEPAHIVDELGDVLWYVAAMATALGVDLSEVAAANVGKLRARYPDGFAADRSRDRD